MSSGKNPSGSDELDPTVAEFRRDKTREDQTYRARALKLLPHVCGHCGRDFEGRKLRELTVHHKDSNSLNNPPDGSNWELLCIYCHDNQHERNIVADAYADGTPSAERETPGIHQPFAALGELLKKKKEE